MWVPLACALVTAVCNSLIAGCAKAAERNRLAPIAYAVIFQAAASALCLIAALGAALPWHSARFWILGVVMGMIYIRALSAIVVANRLGPASFPWALGNIALVVPIVLAAIWLDEPLIPLDGAVFAVFLAMVAMFLLGMRSGPVGEISARGRYAVALAEVFFANGLLMFGYKLKQEWFQDVGSAGFVALVFGSGALIGCITPAGWAWLGSRRAESGGGWKWGLVAGVLGGVAADALLVAARLPAAMVFPIVQGIGLVGGTVVMTVAFRERINGWKVAALVMGIAVVVMAGLRPG